MNDYEKNIDLMIDELKSLNGYNFDSPSILSEKREILKRLMTVSMPGKLSDAYYEAEKFILDYEGEIQAVDVMTLEEQLMDGIYIYKGDITMLKADAIVNAANEKLLGCFIPGHHCIDNAIHLKAGLALRNACYDIMETQGHDEVVGTAKITEGFNLPAKYVIHTVGPNVNGGEILSMKTIEEQLRSCYVSILKMSKDYDLENLVFCSISTGVYGVPIDLAS